MLFFPNEAWIFKFRQYSMQKEGFSQQWTCTDKKLIFHWDEKPISSIIKINRIAWQKKTCILFSIFHPHHNDFMLSTFNMQKVPETCIVSASYCTFCIHILHSWQDNLNEFMIAISFLFLFIFSTQNFTKQKWEWSEKNSKSGRKEE